MIVVMDVSITRVDSDRWAYRYLPNGTPGVIVDAISANGVLPSGRLTVEEKVVTGERFRNLNGDDVVIGMTAEVQEAIGLPFSVFRNMQGENDSLRSSLRQSQAQGARLYSEIEDLSNQVENASLWERVKYVFGAHSFTDKGDHV